MLLQHLSLVYLILRGQGALWDHPHCQPPRRQSRVGQWRTVCRDKDLPCRQESHHWCCRELVETPCLRGVYFSQRSSYWKKEMSHIYAFSALLY